MAEKELSEMSKAELYLELNEGRVAEMRGRVRKQQAQKELRERFPPAAGKDGQPAGSGRGRKKQS